MLTHASTLHRTPARGACPLWQGLRARSLQTVAVMGMSKNTGKTVCLNHLLQQAQQYNLAVGLTSIGRDGEERDEVFAIPKPPVSVTPACLVATARDTLVRAKVRTRLIGSTGIDSPMGEILIVKALEAGAMEVAGPSRSQDQHTVITLLKQCGAELVLLDGALGRSQHASPAIADGVILATGAALGGGMGDVLRKTRDRLAILGIAPAPADMVQRVQATFVQGGVGVWDGQGRSLFNEPIASLNAGPVLLALRAQIKGEGGIAMLAVSGAVGQMLWRAVSTLLDHHPGLTLVVADGTKLFIDAADVAAFERRGGRLLAMRGIRLLGVTLNPFSPYGGSFDARAFVHEARTTLHEHLVTDVLLFQEGS
ncbi:MAG: hypothetical protein HY019_07865 [Aquabacterium sp.]|uniref:lysine 5,6-aminomutase reactivase subunit KamB n=1 Tax=Aquabacterium sp. TaxID=1872578 RepID=UPI0025BD1A7D|nr:hypothetical protein [Aquabacterium sp.]MBI3381909.1 hypothetical protein [Aquabacterium sp.]